MKGTEVGRKITESHGAWLWNFKKDYPIPWAVGQSKFGDLKKSSTLGCPTLSIHASIQLQEVSPPSPVSKDHPLYCGDMLVGVGQGGGRGYVMASLPIQNFVHLRGVKVPIQEYVQLYLLSTRLEGEGS